MDRHGPVFELDWNDRVYHIQDPMTKTETHSSRGETA
jgi:hypothetical protein